MTIELVRHAVADETQVHPAAQRRVGEEEAERARQEHAEAERTMHSSAWIPSFRRSTTSSRR